MLEGNPLLDARRHAVASLFRHPGEMRRFIAIVIGLATISVVATLSTAAAGGSAKPPIPVTGAILMPASALPATPAATPKPATPLPVPQPATPAATPQPPPPPTAVRLGVSYHAQQDPDWCDPASIEMWLQANGTALPGSDDHSIQQQFWNFETANNDGYTIDQWNASPYAVALALDHYGNRNDIGDAPQPTAQAAGTVIAQSLAVRHQPVIVMVSHGTHYVLVIGATLGPGGAAAPPATVTYMNPLGFGVAGSPPAGSDGTQTVSWSDFTQLYTANTAHGGVWAGQWVLIAAGTSLVG